MRAIFLSIVGTLASGHAVAHPVYSHEPADFQSFTDNPLNSLENSGCWTYVGGQLVSENSPEQASPGGVLYSARPHQGSGGIAPYCVLPSAANELFLGFHWKPSDPFVGWVNNTNKIVNFQDCCSQHLLWINHFGAAGSPRLLGFYLANGPDTGVNNCHLHDTWTCDPAGPSNVVSSGVVTEGAWHNIEVYVKRSSSNNSKDGILRMWLNGALVGEWLDVNFSIGGYGQFEATPSWDNTACSGDPQYEPETCNDPQANYAVASTTDSYMFDHFFISTPTGGDGNPNPTPETCGNGLCGSGETSTSCPADCVSLPPSNPPGQIGQVDLSTEVLDNSSVTLKFSEVADDQGAPANYLVCYSLAPIVWPSAVSAGTCQNVVGSQVGKVTSHKVSGLNADTTYEFQAVAYRGALNGSAEFGALSNIVQAKTTAVGVPPVVEPPPDPTTGPNANGTVNCQEGSDGKLHCDGTAVVQGCTTFVPQTWGVFALALRLIRRRRVITGR